MQTRMHRDAKVLARLSESCDEKSWERLYREAGEEPAADFMGAPLPNPPQPLSSSP